MNEKNNNNFLSRMDKYGAPMGARKIDKKPIAFIEDYEDVSPDTTMTPFSEKDLMTFDDYIDNISNSPRNEDEEIEQKLLQYGKQYRTASSDGESAKVFIHQEQMLRSLHDDVKKDVKMIDDEINKRRNSREAYKFLPDMIGSKITAQNTRLSIIKELTNIEKLRKDIAQREKKFAIGDDEAGSMNSQNAIASLFGMSLDTLRSPVKHDSGRIPDYTEEHDYVDDEAVLRNIYKDQEKTDGDIIAEYDGKGIKLILIESDDGDKTVIAEDAEGNLIPEYPVPKDINDYTFIHDNATNTVTDQYYRVYELRKG